MAHYLSAAVVKALVFAFAVVALYAASSTARDFDAAAPAPAPALDKGAAAHSVMASGAMIVCLPIFLSVLALLKH